MSADCYSYPTKDGCCGLMPGDSLTESTNQKSVVRGLLISPMRHVQSFNAPGPHLSILGIPRRRLGARFEMGLRRLEILGRRCGHDGQVLV